MPLWKFYHPVGAFTADDKKALAERITKLYTASKLPAFYVGVVFQEVAEDSFFIGGEPTSKFVRIWIDHIARTMDTKEQRDRALKAFNAAIAPYVHDRGFSWEFHIDETPFDLWSIQGFRPPLPGTEDEARWIRENKPSAPIAAGA
jgi:phenylpyruvate tautomerase PptA (4-oxalocrotonate tautomerase family)